MEPRRADKRLAPDRFRRVWSLVETIEREPGMSRGELARRFSLSERQLQADLIVIRDDLRLPIVRQVGYRFEGSPPPHQRLDLHDALSLYGVVQAAVATDGARAEVEHVGTRLPLAFPPSLRPLVTKLLMPAVDGFGPTSSAYAALITGLLEQRPVQLVFARHAGVGYLTELIVNVEVLLPHREDWYVIGGCEQLRRPVMLKLAGLEGASLEWESTPDVG